MISRLSMFLFLRVADYCLERQMYRLKYVLPFAKETPSTLSLADSIKLITG